MKTFAYLACALLALWPSWLSGPPGSLASGTLALWLLLRFGPLCPFLGFCAFACGLLASAQSVLWKEIFRDEFYVIDLDLSLRGSVSGLSQLFVQHCCALTLFFT
jgi:hypothetical protein